ncbi:MAG: hypothetical protein JNJ71_19450 [Rubrivivax sp.]|nr:hypothetical protein [Rubrivivax sp.]
MSADRDEKFFEVLAGLRKADDAETRRAERLRSHFAAHPLMEQQATDDPEGEARLLAIVRARQAAAPAQPTAQPKAQTQASERPGSWQRLQAWLFPGSGSSGMALSRYGMVGAAVLGAVIAVRWVMPDPDDELVMKELPAASAPISGASAADPRDPSTQGVTERVPDPAAAASALQALLASHGVMATLRVEGREVWLSAQVPASKRAEVDERLQQTGRTLPSSGQLVVRFTP